MATRVRIPLRVGIGGPVGSGKTKLIEARFNYRVPVSLAWTRTPGTNGSHESSESNGTETAIGTALETADAWASTRQGTAILSVTGSAKAITVTLVGQTKPDVGTLQADLRTALPQATITVQWISGGLVVVDSPTSTPTTTPPSTPPR